jgi:hypothetical protein
VLFKNKSVLKDSARQFYGHATASRRNNFQKQIAGNTSESAIFYG